MISREVINKEIYFYRDLQKELGIKLRGLPRGKIYFKQEHGRKRPYRRVNGKETYLSAGKKSIISGLLNRAEIEKAMEHISRNIELLDDVLTKYSNLEEFLPGEYTYPDGDIPKHKISEIIDKWAEKRKHETLPAELFKEESTGKKVRKFRTSDGNYVKSKSELVIYEYLKLRGIPFLYENPTIINGKTRYPDFTIIRQSDGRIILWEHFGMMELEGYKEEAKVKLYDYACEGYWPFKNFISTFEFGDGDLDFAEIERILKMMEGQVLIVV